MKLLGCLAFLSLALLISCNKYVKDGDYFIKNVRFGTYVDACGSDDICPADPNNLYVNDFFGDAFQQFSVKYLKNGYYHIASKVNGKRFEADESKKRADTLSLAKPDNNDRDQQFKIVANKYDSYSIIPRRLDKYAVEAPYKELEELFLGKKDDNNKAQRFLFEPVPAPEPPKKHDKDDKYDKDDKKDKYDKEDKKDKYDKDDKKDKYDKDDKKDKYEKDDKKDKYEKEDKHDKYDKYDKEDKYDKKDKYDKDDKYEKHDKYDKKEAAAPVSAPARRTGY